MLFARMSPLPGRCFRMVAHRGEAGPTHCPDPVAWRGSWRAPNARFTQLHVRDGELDGVRILSPEAAASMRRITVRGRRYDLGLGWFRPASQRDADPPFVEHLGGGAGFFHVMRVYPSRGVGVVVMGNATSYDIDGVARLALTG